MSTAHLGEVVAALVDGELDHTSRERAQRHLLDCAECRAEVEAQRRLKASLAQLAAAPPAPADLVDRLLALQVPGTDRGSRGPLRPAAPVPLRPTARAPRPHRRRRLRRGATVGGAVAALGAVALALGGQPTGPSTRVDPATDSFVVQHVDTTSEVPRAVRATLTGGGSAR